MAQISIDNGLHYYDANDVLEIGRGDAANWKGIYGADTLKPDFESLMGVIVASMDNDVRESVAYFCDCENDFEFLAEYLNRADHDLVVG